MPQINDPVLLGKYMQKYRIPELFDTEDLPFLLWKYEPGEQVNGRHDMSSTLKFVVRGAFQIYHIRPDGSTYPICLLDKFTLLGDLEFCGQTSLPFVTEAVDHLTCVELPLAGIREKLLNDNRFLRFMLQSAAEKLVIYVRGEASFKNLEEKLLDMLQNDCPDRTLRGVEKAAIRLRCSRRQLQRILRALTERGVLEKPGKGIYRLKA